MPPQRHIATPEAGGIQTISGGRNGSPLHHDAIQKDVRVIVVDQPVTRFIDIGLGSGPINRLPI